MFTVQYHDGTRVESATLPENLETAKQIEINWLETRISYTFLRVCIHLERLTITNSNLDDRDAYWIVDYLKGHETIRAVNVCDNHFSPEGYLFFVGLLEKSKSITTFYAGEEFQIGALLKLLLV